MVCICKCPACVHTRDENDQLKIQNRGLKEDHYRVTAEGDRLRRANAQLSEQLRLTKKDKEEREALYTKQQMHLALDAQATAAIEQHRLLREVVADYVEGKADRIDLIEALQGQDDHD